MFNQCDCKNTSICPNCGSIQKNPEKEYDCENCHSQVNPYIRDGVEESFPGRLFSRVVGEKPVFGKIIIPTLLDNHIEIEAKLDNRRWRNLISVKDIQEKLFSDIYKNTLQEMLDVLFTVSKQDSLVC